MNTIVKRLLPTVAIWCLTATTAYAVDVVCKGRVVDANTLEPLYGATVKVKDTPFEQVIKLDGKTATAVKQDGTFSITVPTGTKLQVMYVGYDTADVTAKENIGTVTMQASVWTGEESYHEPTPEEVEEWIEEGHRYFNDGKYSKAFKLFEEAAYENNAKAEYLTGLCYLDGYGVDKDAVKAGIWIFSAADKGYVDAQYMVGVMFRDGIGSVQSNKAALEWFTKAASQGHEKAKAALKELGN